MPPSDVTKILLLEDSAEFALLVQAWLKAMPDVSVTWARDLPDAQAQLSAGVVDVLLADVDLPSGDSFETLMLARQRSPDIQIVVMTAHQRADYAVAALRARVDEFLFKPFDRDTLVTLTQRLAAERRERNQRQRRVLAIGSHPDDVEIGCGGSLRAHVLRGDVVHILTLTGGEAGGAVSTRMAESKAAAAILGAKLTIANLVDTNISEGAETITVIESAIAKFRPTVIYTHSVHDGHQDHRNVARATAVAARRVPSLLCYQAPSTTIAFAPTRFTDVTQTLRDKQAAIQAFQSQAGRPYMTPEMIEATARYWGRFAGYGLCEPFEVVRELAQ